jgi:hypothetical protein
MKELIGPYRENGQGRYEAEEDDVAAREPPPLPRVMEGKDQPEGGGGHDEGVLEPDPPHLGREIGAQELQGVGQGPSGDGEHEQAKGRDPKRGATAPGVCAQADQNRGRQNQHGYPSYTHALTSPSPQHPSPTRGILALRRSRTAPWHMASSPDICIQLLYHVLVGAWFESGLSLV